MNLKQAKQIDLILSIYKDKNMLQKSTFRLSSDKLKTISDDEFDKLIAIIRKEQLKLGVELIKGNSYSFKFFSPQITDLESLGGFEKMFWKKLFINFMKYVVPIITLSILIYVHFIKESDLKLNTETLKNTKEKELIIMDTIQTKKTNLIKLNEKANREHNLKTKKSDSLK